MLKIFNNTIVLGIIITCLVGLNLFTLTKYNNVRTEKKHLERLIVNLQQQSVIEKNIKDFLANQKEILDKVPSNDFNQKIPPSVYNAIKSFQRQLQSNR